MYPALALLFLYLPPGYIGPRESCDGQEVLRVPARGAAVLHYRRTGARFKPYVVQLRTPSGTNVVRDNVEDHLHHHGLMFAWKVNGVNFWEELPESGTLRTDRAQDRGSGLLDTLTWLSPTSEALLIEERRVVLLPSGDPQATLVSWQSTFQAPRTSKDSKPSITTIGGAHYHGLGMRFLQVMDGGTFTGAQPETATVFRGEERLWRGEWCAYTASVAGKEVTVAMFDHPKNPRPVTWFTMARPFAYLSATLRLHEDALEIEAGKPLTLRYGVALWDGLADKGSIERVRRAWLRQAGERSSPEGEALQAAR